MSAAIVPFVPIDPTYTVLREETPSLYLYKCLLKTDVDRTIREGVLSVKQQGPDEGYIGLRETPEGSVERATLFHDHVDKATHCILQQEFSPQGIAYFTTQYQGPDRQFQSTLFKKPTVMSPRIG